MHQGGQSSTDLDPQKGIRAHAADALASGATAQKRWFSKPPQRRRWRDCRFGLQHALQPLASDRAVDRQFHRSGHRRLATPCRRPLTPACRLLDPQNLDLPNQALVSRSASNTPKDRREFDRDILRHSSRANLWKKTQRIAALCSRQSLCSSASPPGLVAYPPDRGDLGSSNPACINPPAGLRRLADPPRPIDPWRPDDVLGLPRHAARSDRNTYGQRGSISKQPRWTRSYS